MPGLTSCASFFHIQLNEQETCLCSNGNRKSWASSVEWKMYVLLPWLLPLECLKLAHKNIKCWCACVPRKQKEHCATAESISKSSQFGKLQSFVKCALSYTPHFSCSGVNAARQSCAGSASVLIIASQLIESRAFACDLISMFINMWMFIYFSSI